jgi:hypothetical protein
MRRVVPTGMIKNSQGHSSRAGFSDPRVDQSPQRGNKPLEPSHLLSGTVGMPHSCSCPRFHEYGIRNSIGRCRSNRKSRLHHSCSLKRASILSIASCCMAGNTCEYIFAVVLKLLCPRSSCITFIDTPILNKSVAVLCRRS